MPKLATLPRPIVRLLALGVAVGASGNALADGEVNVYNSRHYASDE